MLLENRVRQPASLGYSIGFCTKRCADGLILTGEARVGTKKESTALDSSKSIGWGGNI